MILLEDVEHVEEEEEGVHHWLLLCGFVVLGPQCHGVGVVVVVPFLVCIVIVLGLLSGVS